MRFAKNTQHHTSQVMHPPRKQKIEVSKLMRLPGNMELIFWKPCKSIALVRKTTWERHVRMSQSAMPPTRNDAARRFKPPKVTTPRRHGHRVPTQSCFRRLLTVASTKAASSEHRSTPRPQSKTRTLRAFGIIREKYIFLTIHGIIQQKSAKYDQSIPPCLMDNHQWQRIVHSAHPRKI